MNDWFRSWHGAPTDPKWLVIGKKVGVAAGIVSAIVWALLDHASQADDRGTVGDFDFETYAAVSGFDEDMVRAVYGALEAKAVIISGRLAKWEKRQPRREDSSSSERVRNHRRKAEAEPGLPLAEPESKPQIRAEKDVSPAEPSLPPAAEKDVPAEQVSASMISPQAHDLAAKVTRAAGHDLDFIPPAWAGAAYRVQTWLDKGWRAPLILESVRAQLAHKRDGPPRTIQYFEPGIAAAHARADAPLPVVNPSEPQVIHGKTRNRGGFGGLALALAGADADGADLGGGGQPGARSLRVINGSGHS